MKLNIKTACTTFVVALGIFIIIRVMATALGGEEGRLTKTIHKAKRLAERENIVGLRDFISADYSDELGNDRRSLLFIAKNFFDEYRNILILIDALKIAIDEKKAVADIEATVYWQEKTSQNINYDTAKVKASFKKEENRWKLIELRFFEEEKKNLFHPMIG